MMEQIVGEERTEICFNQKKQSQQISRPKGGLRTMPFIIGNQAFENVASYGLQPNMILYLMSGYNMDNATGTNILLLWSAASNFMPVLGAFISDSYLGRFRVIGMGSIATFLGMILLWLTTMVPQLKPSPCSPSSQSCESATPAQLGILFLAFGVMSIGCGCIRPCSLAFGADQLNKKDNIKNERVLNSYFSLYYLFSGVSITLAITVVVYIQDHMGWKLGFGVSAILMFFSALFFWLGSPLYIKVKAGKSLFIRFAQVVVVSLKNRNLSFPPKNSIGRYHGSHDFELLAPTDRLRCLNKACIIRDHEEGIDGSTSGPWNLCSVDQVEEFKSLVRILPIWSTSIMVAVTISLPSFGLLQANTMNRHITSNFEIPAGSFGLFTLVTLLVWVAIYDPIIVPQLAKLTGRPNGLSLMQRMGVGLLLSCMAMVLGAFVESVRRRTAIQQGFSDNPQAMMNMSVMWLVPQPCLVGLAEAFYAIGQIEFIYSQLPKNMSSIGMALGSLGMAIGNLVGSAIIAIVNDLTKKGGTESWVSGNPNKGHYDYYYWLLFVLSLVNFLHFLVCCWAYGPYEGEGTRITDDGKCYVILESHSGDEELP